MIESFPDGAVARHGPDKAVFAQDLNTEAVFDILASDGKPIRGGLRAIQATDLASGKSLVLATVKQKAPGQLFPPNRLAYIDCMEGLKVDLVLEWRHNQFSHDVMFREQPRLPVDWDTRQVRLELVTEMLVDAEPELRSQMRQDAGQLELQDDVVIHFGAMAMLMGSAFPLDEQNGFTLGGQIANKQATQVLKQWHRSEDGRRFFLIESVSWPEVLPQMKGLPAVAQAAVTRREAALARTWPERKTGTMDRKPVQIASAKYEPKGFVLDFVIVPDQAQPTTFTATDTYILRTTYYIGTSANFEPGCVIKRWANNGASLVLYGSIYFPDSLQSCVFTSIDDDSYGLRFPGSSSPYIPASDGNPADNVYDDALKMWYVNYSTEVRNALFRWAQSGIEYWSTGASADHAVRTCRFENLSYGVDESINPARSLTFINSEKCSVTADVNYLQGQQPTTSLSVSLCCIGKSFPGIDKSIADNPSPPLPDSMGAIGTQDFIEVITTGKIVRFNRNTGVRAEELGLTTFLNTSKALDPRIWFDNLGSTPH